MAYSYNITVYVLDTELAISKTTFTVFIYVNTRNFLFIFTLRNIACLRDETGCEDADCIQHAHDVVRRLVL